MLRFLLWQASPDVAERALRLRFLLWQASPDVAERMFRLVFVLVEGLNARYFITFLRHCKGTKKTATVQ